MPPHVIYRRIHESVEAVLVVGHTDCGARTFDEEAIKQTLRERAPTEYAGVVEGLQFGKIGGSVEQSVQEDVSFLKDSPLVREGLKEGIFRLVFDIETGSPERVA